jgi:hypothetical protein
MNQVFIYNIHGVLKENYQVEGIDTNLDLSDLGAGIYFIQVKNNLYRQTRKLILQ